METKRAEPMEDQRFRRTEDAQTIRFNTANVHSFVEGVYHKKTGDGKTRPCVSSKLHGGEGFDECERNYSASDSLPSLITPRISSTSIQESVDLFEHAVISSLQKSVADMTVNEAGECTGEKKVNFSPGCSAVPQTSDGKRTRACCDEFMEQTISVHEIERIFDIDFEKNRTFLTTESCPAKREVTGKRPE
ncbi:uncharacterized protein LOC111259777 [Varroa jacobsoni]|uniref:uncharacterized protein LOC111259777 n=1 Tax=Varroa jacobsoni TaxID=62625 RepID=UPI000BF4C48A|nr:uncharacterized protein LOC111259777 [Varroa jacobsoni]